MVETRIWNLVPLAALLATGCGPDTIMIPIDESETGDGDGDPGDGDGDSSGDGDGDGDGDPGDGDGDGGDGDGDGYTYEDWCDDDPCPEGYNCVSSGDVGHCYGCYSGFNGTSCGPGEACFGAACEVLDDLPECQGPTMVELPIPVPAQGDVLDLSFGDLDGDMLDELLVLHAGELIVVRDGVTSSTFAVDPLADEVTALHIDGDAALDVLLSSAVDDHAAVLLGVGDGTLMPPSPRTLLGLQHTRALDWPAGGANELVGVAANGEAFRVSELATEPPVAGSIDEGGDTVVAIHPGDFDGDGADDVLIHRVDSGHRYSVVSSLEGVLGGKAFHFLNIDVRSTAFARPSNAQWGYVFTLQHGAETDIHVYSFDPYYGYPNNAGVIASDEIRDLTHVVGLGLALATTSDTKLVEILEIDNITLGCVSSPGLPASTRVVAGDFADNQGHELALVDDQGMIRVWARSP
jgi:hypothetical protein